MTTNLKRIDLMRERLESSLNPQSLEIMDDSHQHVGHEGAKSGRGHFIVIIKANCFRDKTQLECHRLVYEALGTLMNTDIHALRIIAKPA